MKIRDAIYPIRQALENNHAVIFNVSSHGYDCIERSAEPARSVWMSRYDYPDGDNCIYTEKIAYRKFIWAVRMAAQDIARTQKISII